MSEPQTPALPAGSLVTLVCSSCRTPDGPAGWNGRLCVGGTRRAFEANGLTLEAALADLERQYREWVPLRKMPEELPWR